MKNITLITIISIFLLSATVVEVNRIIVEPKTPTSVKVISGYLSTNPNSSNTNSNNLESALNTYKNMGYVVKISNYNSNGNYLIILEKY